MKIALVVGRYANETHRRSAHFVTPETMLAEGLLRRGHDVQSFSHYAKLNSEEFDVVHVHHLSYGAMRMALDVSATPFVYTSHDGSAMAGLDPGLLRRIAARVVISRADAVVALSQAEARFQAQEYDLQDALHAVIPNAIGSAYQYGRRNSGGKGRPWQLLYVGQLIALKRVDILLRALDIALERENLELTLAYHHGALENSLRKLAHELGLQDRVRFLGSKSPDELAQLYQRADVLILPSLAEALPSVVTEAMACGTPVIATDVGGVRDQLGGYGMCVPVGESPELAATILRALRNYGEFQRHSEAASEYARTRFCSGNMVDRHAELYSGLVCRTAQRRRRVFSRAPVDALLKMGMAAICATK